MQLNHALQNSMVSGAAFEFIPLHYDPILEEDIGCRHILQLHKACYLLASDGGSQDYVGDLRKVMLHLGRQSGLLENPKLFIVLSAYSRPDNATIHFLSKGRSDHNSVEAAVAWLKAYRASHGS